jgi:hypothetical protein
MSSTAKEIRDYLVSANVLPTSLAAEWSCHVASEPEKPNNTVTIYDIGGLGVDTDELDLVTDGVQVRVRCVKYEEGYAKQVAIRKALNVAAFDGSGRRVIGVTPEGTINSLGKDDNRRFLIVSDFRVLSKET